eukprot:scaffold71659_cov57-Attheya_sp.AAC.8
MHYSHYYRMWSAGLIHHLWLLIHDLWEHCNAVIHDCMATAIQQAPAQLSNVTVFGQYHQGLHGLSPSYF